MMDYQNYQMQSSRGNAAWESLQKRIELWGVHLWQIVGNTVRPPLPYARPLDKQEEKSPQTYSNISDYLDFIKSLPPVQTEAAEKIPAPQEETETGEIAVEKEENTENDFRTSQGLFSAKLRRKLRREMRLKKALAEYNPSKDPNAKTDPNKTIFVARIAKDASERLVKREFEHFGRIRKLTMVMDKEKKTPRGYAFIEYERTKDAEHAYRHADGLKLNGKRVLVDMEKGRVDKNWLPRRLGGSQGRSKRIEPPHRERESFREKDSHRERDRDGFRERERSHRRPRLD